MYEFPSEFNNLHIMTIQAEGKKIIQSFSDEYLVSNDSSETPTQKHDVEIGQKFDMRG